MKLSIIGIVGVPSNYGGFETLVENLLPLSNQTIIYCSKKAYDNRQPLYKDAKLVYLPLDANGVQSIFYDILAILHTLLRTKNDIFVLGVSGAILFPFIKLFFRRRRLVINIDGLEWKRDKWGAVSKNFLKFSEWISVRLADSVVADNKAIAEYVYSQYGVSCITIAYGGDHAITGSFPSITNGYALSLCRIEPENNVELILTAFSNYPFCKIKFVGNWDRSEYGRRLKKKYSIYENIELLDPIYDLEVLFILRSQCEFYVHGHSAGGTNPSLVEMMFFGKPILAFNCEYNRYTTNNGAAYFDDLSGLISLLGIATKLNHSQLVEFAKREYTWKVIREKYLKLLCYNNS